MTTLIIEDETTMLQEVDFPDYYIDKRHPDDYIPVKKCFTEYIYHSISDHNILILRICFKIGHKTYIPCSFICDTGAPTHIYINSTTRKMIKDLIQKDELENEFLIIDNKRMMLKPSPSNNPDVNIIGLRSLSYFNLILKDDGFVFLNLPKYF